MLLRSSSTPILGSVLSSISDSPNHETNSLKHHHHHHHHQQQHLPPPAAATNHHHTYKKFQLPTVSCNTSPISPSVNVDFTDSNKSGFRRVQSEGNLEGLAFASCHMEDLNHNNKNTTTTTHTQSKPQKIGLQTIPSFSSRTGMEDEEYQSDEEERKELEEYVEWLDRYNNGRRGIVGGETGVVAMGGNGGGGGLDFSFKNEMTNNMAISERVQVMDRLWNVGFDGDFGLVGQEMHLAKGLGLGGGGGLGGSDFYPPGFGGGGGDGGGDSQDVEDYYKRMVDDNPGNPLFLRNYAQFLYKTKHNLNGAEEYYSRAILADPEDGEILSQYARLVWELHGDQDRASCYFQRAVQASPADSAVHAAYAGFLWDTEEDSEECNVPNELAAAPKYHGAVAY